MDSTDGPNDDNHSSGLQRFFEEGRKRVGEIKSRRQTEQSRRQTELRRVAFETVQQETREGFEKTRNPLFVWCAIRHCIIRDEQLPAWALGYLLNCANTLSELTKEPPKDVNRAVGRAFGFTSPGRGRGSPFSRFKNLRRRGKDALLFARKVLDGEKPYEAATQVAAETQQSDTAVWNEIREFFKDHIDAQDKIQWSPLIEQLSKYPEFLALLPKDRE